MSVLRSMLIHTCTIQVRTGASAVDDWQGESWADEASGVPCLYQQRRVREFDTQTRSSIAVEENVIYVEYRAVTNQHRIVNVAKRSGTVIEAGPLDIEAPIDMAGQEVVMRLHVKKAT